MIDRIRELESIARLLEPDQQQRMALAKCVIEYAEDFLENLPTAPAYASAQGHKTELFEHPIQENGIAIEQALGLLKRNVDSQGVNTPSDGHLAFIPGGPLYHSALGDFLADVSNRFSGNFFSAPGAVRIENMLVHWMASIVGYPSAATGNLTPGGSMANLTAILTAREAVELKAKDFARVVVYLTNQAHHSITKALRIAGLGECLIHSVPVDDRNRMNVDALTAAILADRQQGLRPWLVIATAGTTDTGAVDPLEAIQSIASQHNLWMHVDGAYGGFFALCEQGRTILKGMELSNSLTLDPQKGLFLPFGTGAVLVRDGQKLFEAMYAEAHYLQDAIPSPDEMSPKDLSPELSRPFRGLRLWLPLQLLGTQPFQAALEEKLLLARYFYQEVQKIAGIEVGAPPDLSIVAFRFLPKRGDANEFNQKWNQSIQQDGRIFISSTTLQGIFWLRMAILGFRTHRDTIDRALEILKEKVIAIEHIE